MALILSMAMPWVSTRGYEGCYGCSTFHPFPDGGYDATAGWERQMVELYLTALDHQQDAAAPKKPA